MLSRFALFPAIALALTGCAARPSDAYVRRAAQAFLDKNAVCVFFPETVGRARDEVTREVTYFVTEAQVPSLQPFVEAGWIAWVERSSHGDEPDRRWFEITKRGNAQNVDCLINANRYPQQYEVGFRFARRAIQKIAPMLRPTESPCFLHAIAAVTYRLEADPVWTNRARLRTNLSAFEFDEKTGEGLALVPFARARDGRSWTQVDLPDVHTNVACVSLDQRQ